MQNQSIQKFKADIKVLALNQRALKNQRKTVHLIGERTMHSWEAAYKHANNRHDLRHLYIAYGLMRGRTIQQIEGENRSPYSSTLVNEIIAKYACEQAVCSN